MTTPKDRTKPPAEVDGPADRSTQNREGESATATTDLPEASSEARRLAAAILEVLAGVRGPTEMSQVLGISLARYYQLERRALAGLLAACEPRRRGRGQRSSNELAALRQEC